MLTPRQFNPSIDRRSRRTAFVYRSARNKAGNARWQISSKVAVARSRRLPTLPEGPGNSCAA
jgi:hypothetical protein